MPEGICIFAENYDGNLDNSVPELVTAAHVIKAETGEKIEAVVVSDKCSVLSDQLAKLGIDEIYTVQTDHDPAFQDDSLGHVYAEMIRRIAPSAVLIPATPAGRSIFSRTAAVLGCGMTADCTELKVAKRGDRSFYIKQNKPSFGDNVFVTIEMKPGVFPQMMTIRPGVFAPYESCENITSKTSYFDDIEMSASGITVMEAVPAAAVTGSILGADTVVVGGRGAQADGNMELLKQFADKIGAAVGCTRPIADTGVIPFEHQIGQTGATIHPRICISLGVSGAIQHTEGIKDTKLFVAVNTDENAPIYNVADYGINADMKEVLEAYMKL